jgi:putative peptide maturation system protein
MKALLPQALSDTIDYLMSLDREGIRPEQARERLRLLQEQYPGIAMDLLWEAEAYDKSVHYDTLLRLVGDGTVSLSFCSGRALPWPLRGVQPWSEQDLVRVNDTVLRVDQAMAFLDFVWDEARIVTRLVDLCLIREELDRNPIELGDSDLQRAIDGFRRGNKLYKVEDAYRWMERRGMTHEKLELLVAEHAMIDKLRERISSGRVEEYFDNHLADFDSACIAQIEFSGAESAEEACCRIRNGAVGFFESATARFLEAVTRSETSPSATFKVVRRGGERSEVAAAVFKAKVGDLLGPILSEQGYLTIRVLSLTPARLDESTKSVIKNLLFEQWLSERRKAAAIEWYWGRADSTSQAVMAKA